MAARIPIAFLSQEQKLQIVKDLHLIEPDSRWGVKDNKKTLDFFLVDKTDILLPYNYACKFLKRPHINSRRKYFQVPVWNFRPGFQLYDYQEEVISLANEHYTRKGSAFINVFCAFGKTVVGAYFCQKFVKTNGLLSLITFPRNILEKSWSGTFGTHTETKVHVVGLGPGPEIIPEDTQIILCQDTRLKRLPPEIRSRIGHLVIDEADRYCTISHIEGILGIEPLAITLLTATYERDDGMQVMLDLLSGEDRITRISKKPFFVFHYPTGFVPQDVKETSRGIQYDSLVSALDIIPERNLLICNLAIMNLYEKSMILTYHVEHAHFLANCLAEMVAPYGKTVALLAGTIKSYTDSDILVGTISKIGVGFDEKEVAIGWNRPIQQGGQRRINLLILASIGLKIEQIAGRVFRAPVPVIIDLVDEFKNNKTHYGVRKKWYESRNGYITKARDLYQAIWFKNGPRLIQEYTDRLAMLKGRMEKAETEVSSENKMGHSAGKTLEDNHTSKAYAKYLAIKKKQ